MRTVALNEIKRAFEASSGVGTGGRTDGRKGGCRVHIPRDAIREADRRRGCIPLVSRLAKTPAKENVSQKHGLVSGFRGCFRGPPRACRRATLIYRDGPLSRVAHTRRRFSPKEIFKSDGTRCAYIKRIFIFNAI